MQKTYNVIFLNNQGYMVEQIIAPRKGDWVYEYNNTIPIYQFSYDMESYPLPKIMASTHKALGLPILPPIEEDIEKIANLKYTRQSENKPYCEIKDVRAIAGFIEGYKAASTKKFTKEDMRKAWNASEIEHIAEHEQTDATVEELGGQTFEQFIQSLNPQPIAVIVEMELVEDNDFSDYEEGGTHPGVTTSQYEPKVDENNQIIVKFWVYE